MDWEKAKNLTVIFLVILNLFLGSFLYLERNRYVMDAERVKDIEDVLAKNNILLNKLSIPRSYPPQKPLFMSGYSNDAEEWLAIFFPGLTDILISEEPDRTVYSSGQQTLTLQNGYASFDNPQGTDTTDLTQAAVIRACDTFLRGMGDEISRFQFDSIFVDGDGYRVQYCQKYKGTVISTNFVMFMVTRFGIVQVDCQFSEPIGFAGKPMAICAADEALLIFTRRFISAYGARQATVSHMDLVYSQREGSAQDGITLKATPYYRVFVDQLDAPFTINAYLNTE
jgi:hypothetical protein